MIEIVKYSKRHKVTLLKLLNNKNVSDWLLLVPYPYTEKDAKWWINHCKKLEGNGKDFLFALENNGEHIGGIALHKILEHSAELGYWLGEPYWGKGYMIDAINKILNIGFKDLKLTRIFAYAFENNSNSEKVLIRTGFEYEGLLKKYHKKGETFINSKLYASVI